MNIVDLAYESIRLNIAVHKPERGGALYGPRDYPLITHFEYDESGETSSVSYIPSTKLIENVGVVERNTGLQFKGIVHSHPAGFTRPSLGDEQTVQSFFRLNPHISTMALPIVQQVINKEGQDKLNFIHWYRAERRASLSSSQYSIFGNRLGAQDLPPVAVLSEEINVIPIGAHVNYLLNRLEEGGLKLVCDQKIQNLKIASSELMGLVAKDSLGHEFMYFVPMDYPVVAPIVLYQRGEVTESLPFMWNGVNGNFKIHLGLIAQDLLKFWKAGARISEVV